MAPEEFELVRLASGPASVRYRAFGETIHPGVGPVAEAEAVYARQLRLRERFHQREAADRPFVLWDVGLGTGANVLTCIRAMTDPEPGGAPIFARTAGSATLQVESFDCSRAPLRFALDHQADLPHLAGFEAAAAAIVDRAATGFTRGGHGVTWTMHEGDFPALLRAWQDGTARRVEPPDAILFDPFSPVKNPAMWSLEMFRGLAVVLDPGRPCALATYSRATFVRVSLLLAGWFVGTGQGTAAKEETTVAANRRELLDQPLGPGWLGRASRSDSAEPLTGAGYRRAPLAVSTLEALARHPQFS